MQKPNTANIIPKTLCIIMKQHKLPWIRNLQNQQIFDLK